MTWIVDGLVTRNVDDAVYYDRTVQTKPRKRASAEEVVLLGEPER